MATDDKYCSIPDDQSDEHGQNPKVDCNITSISKPEDVDGKMHKIASNGMRYSKAVVPAGTWIRDKAEFEWHIRSNGTASAPLSSLYVKVT